MLGNIPIVGFIWGGGGASSRGRLGAEDNIWGAMGMRGPRAVLRQNEGMATQHGRVRQVRQRVGSNSCTNFLFSLASGYGPSN